MKAIKKIIEIFGLITSVPFLICVFLLFPCMLVIFAIAGGGDDESDEKYDVWTSVKEEIRQDYELDNDISGWMMAFTFTTKKGHEESNRHLIKSFIMNEMCLLDWKENEDDAGTVDRFKTYQEILDDVKSTVDETDYYEFIQRLKAHYIFQEPYEIGDYPYPLENFRITSTYGERPNPTGEGKVFHHGIDLVSSENPYAPIMSISDGEVIAVNLRKNKLGNYIIIKYWDNGGTFYGVYGHLSGILIDIGEDVTAGEIIGFQGGKKKVDPNAGNSTGRHLHFEIRTNPFTQSSSVNPTKYLSDKSLNKNN